MTSFPGSPPILKGAVVHVDPPDPAMDVVVFQYNPSTLTRSLATPSEETEEGAAPTRLKGAPTETITLEVAIDATDQLEKQNPTAVSMGIHPKLATLEMLLYPASSTITGSLTKLALGALEILPPAAPLTLFIYGPRRIVPVRLTQFSVTEEAHDVQLNPIRAKVSLGMRVLSYNDLAPDHPGHAIFFAHQIAKEALAQIGSAQGLESATGMDTDFL